MGRHFTLHAFHPKAMNDKMILAGLLACSLFNTFPSLIVTRQWYVD